MNSQITYLQGDATRPEIAGNRIIVHICNDIGGWGKGFVMAISKRWPQPENAYRTWFKEQANFELGQIQLVQVESDIWVCNLIGQHKLNRDADGNPPIRYKAIEDGLDRLCNEVRALNATVHMPRIGCGLAGGTWDKVEPIIERTLISKGINVFVYDL